MYDIFYTSILEKNTMIKKYGLNIFIGMGVGAILGIAFGPSIQNAPLAAIVGAVVGMLVGWLVAVVIRKNRRQKID